MSSPVVIIKTDTFRYPDPGALFRPGRRYPECPFPETAPAANAVYDAVRDAFALLFPEQPGFGTAAWNPLSGVIRPGMHVLIKPNLVMERNGNPEGGTDCLYTQPAVVAPVIDYVVLALHGQGRITVGDAPMQECRFDVLAEQSGYRALIDYYRRKGVDIGLADLRERTVDIRGGVYVPTVSDRQSGTVIDLGDESAFFGADASALDRMRVTNYDPRVLKQHHQPHRHEYLIANVLLDADVIVNMPKPKSHRKAGATIALKNLVGINTRKEYLPHHTMGAPETGGDEYDKGCAVHTLAGALNDRKNRYEADGRYALAALTRYAARACSVVLRLTGRRFREGSWYGNRTISRTIADLNKIVRYAGRDGRMHDGPARPMIIVADMIVSGEREGPIEPSPKDVGVIAAGLNPVCFDEAIAALMGFDPQRIPGIVSARGTEGRYRLAAPDETPLIRSNDPQLDGRTAAQIDPASRIPFEPTSGWKGHIEL